MDTEAEVPPATVESDLKPRPLALICALSATPHWLYHTGFTIRNRRTDILLAQVKTAPSLSPYSDSAKLHCRTKEVASAWSFTESRLWGQTL